MTTAGPRHRHRHRHRLRLRHRLLHRHPRPPRHPRHRHPATATATSATATATATSTTATTTAASATTPPRRPRMQALIAPPAGARLSQPPLLRWRAARRARFYNVQLFRSGVKILSLWPTRARLKLRRQWTYKGRVQRLRPGLYAWAVWPAFGEAKKPRYGRMLGHQLVPDRVRLIQARAGATPLGARRRESRRLSARPERRTARAGRAVRSPSL